MFPGKTKSARSTDGLIDKGRKFSYEQADGVFGRHKGPTPMSKSVFISSAPQDELQAVRICRLLEQEGISCWMASRDMRVGVDSREDRTAAIEASKVVVFLLSMNANRSVCVRRDLTQADTGGKIIIPFRTDKTEPGRSLELLLASFQWFDGSIPPIEERVKLMADAIKGMVNPQRGWWHLGSLRGHPGESTAS